MGWPMPACGVRGPHTVFSFLLSVLKSGLLPLSLFGGNQTIHDQLFQILHGPQLNQ